MGKKQSSGKVYTSKGERRSVNRSVCNAMRRERKANPTWRMIAGRFAFIANLEKRKDAAAKEQLRRIREKEAEYNRAEELFEKYASKGLKWEAALFAVKTNWVTNLEAKYGNVKP